MYLSTHFILQYTPPLSLSPLPPCNTSTPRIYMVHFFRLEPKLFWRNFSLNDFMALTLPKSKTPNQKHQTSLRYNRSDYPPNLPSERLVINTIDDTDFGGRVYFCGSSREGNRRIRIKKTSELDWDQPISAHVRAQALGLSGGPRLTTAPTSLPMQCVWTRNTIFCKSRYKQRLWIDQWHRVDVFRCAHCKSKTTGMRDA